MNSPQPSDAVRPFRFPSQEVEMTSPLRRMRAALALGTGLALLCACALAAAAQTTGTIRGKVTDATTGRPVDGAQLYVAGTDLGTLSNADGQYQFTVRAGTVELRSRRVGYATATQQVTVTPGEATVADFSLKQAAIGLDAVVVTGTGAETEKRKLGNTVATIDAAALKNAPVVSFSEQLAAREPGVSVLPSGGLTGEGARIRIRGSASLSQPNEPVVYVDGVRVDRAGGFGDYIGTGGGGSPSRLDDINPEAIERIEVLKGAAAATLYGTEASSGVIQIFTKAGSRGAPRFDIVSEQGAISQPDSRYEPNFGFARTAAEAQRLGLFYFNNANALQPFQLFSRPVITSLFETGYTTSQSASVSGGTPGVTYYVNGRFYQENGPWGARELGPAQDFDRKVQGSASVVILPTDNVKLRVNAQYADANPETPTNNNNIYGTTAEAMFAKPELATCYTGGVPTGDGHCALPDASGNPIPGTIGPGNPLGQAAFATVRENQQERIRQSTKHFTGNVNAVYQPWSQLSVEGTFGVDVVNQVSTAFR